ALRGAAGRGRSAESAGTRSSIPCRGRSTAQGQQRQCLSRDLSCKRRHVFTTSEQGSQVLVYEVSRLVRNVPQLIALVPRASLRHAAANEYPTPTSRFFKK